MPSYETIQREVETEWGGTDVVVDGWAEDVLTGAVGRSDEVAVGFTESSSDEYSAVSVPVEGLLRGTIVYGSSGYGKSTFSVNVFTQLAEAGYGYCYIDTKSDSCVDLLSQLPTDRLDDVVLLGSFCKGEVSGFDLFEMPPDRGLVADPTQLVAETITEIAIDGKYGSDNRSQLLLKTVQTALEMGIQFEDITNLFSVPPEVVRSETSHSNSFASTLEATEHDSQTVEPVKQRLQRVLQSQQVRQSIASQDPVSLYQAVADGKILIVDASNYIYENRNLFVGALLRKLVEVFQTRPADVNPYFLCVDQIESVGLSAYGLDDVFSKARGWNVGLFLMSQYFSQLPELQRASMKASIDNIVSFNPGQPSVADTAAFLLALESEEELLNLSLYTAITRLSIHNGLETQEVNMFPPLQPRREVEIKDFLSP